MGDYIESNFKDNYNRGREGGGGSNYMHREDNPVWNEDDTMFSKKKEMLVTWLDLFWIVLIETNEKYLILNYSNYLSRLNHNTKKRIGLL